MTVPEENRPKTGTTDDTVFDTDATDTADESTAGGTGRTVREAMEEAGVRPEDFEEQERK
ncbi:hypothetical protein GCM10018785_22460 [Streptomyces longispororuber]|uniref:Uncharacterized protein n=1 Tax=Streptomyces longispororuber TaxID=68230 RepID=A0A918ZHV7_9ACTN|nr:hypothetical protein [Streptomyces longispororuber]GHE52396.1 hypothetical protein GCM10018785_22460 [Streptomyces longispororuber]